MQLSYLYSNKNTLFEPIEFNCRENSNILNVVYGAVTDSSDVRKDSHNLGKTTLVHLLDFMFLKNISSTSHFLEARADRFKGFEFFLEVALNSGDYVTIKRGVENSTKISIKQHDERLKDFINLSEEEWDHNELGLDAARDLLDGLFSLRSLKKYSFRKALSYFLRTQDDYKNVLQLQKFMSGQHVHWKPFVMTLFGFEEAGVKRKFELDVEIAESEQDKKKRQSELQVQEDDLQRLTAEIDNLRVELEQTEAQLDRFEFTDRERRLMHELVDEIEVKISALNDQIYNVKIDLRNIERALSQKLAFKLGVIEDIFRESEINFPDQLKKSYEELVDFNRNVTNERNAALRARKKELVEDLSLLREELTKEDSKKREYQSILHGSDTLEKFKSLQMGLADQRAKLTYLVGQQQRLQEIAVLESAINQLKRDRGQKIDEISALISRGTPIREKVSYLFNEYCKRILDHEGLFYVKLNSQGNVEFPAELIEKGTSKTSRQSDGKSYKQMLCALFDLALLKAYEELPFYHFVYHDGILEGLDNRKKLLFLKLVKELISGGKIQYILSVIEADLPNDLDGKRMDFPENEIILQLHDNGREGRLFKMADF